MSRTVLPCNVKYCMCMMFILIWYSCGRLASKERRQVEFHVTEDAAAWGADCLLGESNTKVNWYDSFIYIYMITYIYIYSLNQIDGNKPTFSHIWTDSYVFFPIKNIPGSRPVGGHQLVLLGRLVQSHILHETLQKGDPSWEVEPTNRGFDQLSCYLNQNKQHGY